MTSCIPYAIDESDAHPCTCRVLMEAGTWRVSERERPEDWRERCEPKPSPVPAPVRDWARERLSAPQIVRAPHRPGAGRPKQPAPQKREERQIGRPNGTGKMRVPWAQISEMTRTRSIREIAAELRVDRSYLYREIKARGFAIARPACLDCHGEIEPNRARNAKRCRECGRKHTVKLHREARRNHTPEQRAHRMEYQAEWKQKRKEATK